MSAYDFLVIGGGALGMLTARELASSGASIALLDRGECAKEASWSGGGILSPLYPWRYSEPVTALCNWSQAHYLALTEQLRSDSDIDPELSKTGLLMLHAEDEERALQWAQTHAHWMEPVGREFIYEKEPSLGPGFERGLWMPHICSVRNPRLGRAIKTTLQKLNNVKLYEYHTVTAIRKMADNFFITSDRGEFTANKIVLAGGAWTSELLQLMGFSLPIQPVRGQMLLFHPAKSILKRIVLTEGKYAIPRKDGRVVVGSTLEYVGFDKSTTEDAREQLSELAF
ncbi:MAG TPA: FAD-dependent oxidoreductase, partial [Pseudomonadales bacterium]|nr:FAD-dependent oxidoreductase [Pseudomonadales bacterium]